VNWSLLLSAFSGAGVLVLGAFTLVRDGRQGHDELRSHDTDAAISGLRDAFEAQRVLTVQCKEKCQDYVVQILELRSEIRSLRAEIAQLRRSP
jgi:hypothetical protein